MLLELDKPIVLILLEARPRIIPFHLVNKVNAFIDAYLPSSEGGSAVGKKKKIKKKNKLIK